MSNSTPGKKRRNGRAAFLALAPEIRLALANGWTLTAIFDEKRARLGMSYAQFTRYARAIREELRAGATLLRLEAVAVRAPTAPSPTIVAPLPASPRRADPPGSPARAPNTPGPPKGRPEDAVPKADLDGFAANVLSRKDLL